MKEKKKKVREEKNWGNGTQIEITMVCDRKPY
jgi:hypothetical protein